MGKLQLLIFIIHYNDSLYYTCFKQVIQRLACPANAVYVFLRFPSCKKVA